MKHAGAGMGGSEVAAAGTGDPASTRSLDTNSKDAAPVGAAPSREVSHLLGTGVLVAGRYEIVNLLGRGGMGEVYVARDLALGLDVALKVLRRGRRGGSGARGLEQEVAVARRVAHPSLARVFDLGVHESAHGDSIVFLTMELYAGGTLAEHLAAEGALAPGVFETWALEICAALAALHDGGVIHRDLKPSNILLVERAGVRHVLVTDFGLATPLGDGQDHGERVGTPAYMAPEQIAGAPLSPASDLYALGVVLFEMLAGRRPLDGGEIRARPDRAPPRIRTLRKDTPKAWDAVIAALLARDPPARPVSARAVARRIDRARPARRRRVLGLAVACLVVLGGAGVFAARGRDPAPLFPDHRPFVVVLPFRGEHADPADQRAAAIFEELVFEQLRLGGAMRTPPPEARGDLAAIAGTGAPIDELARLRRATGAEVGIAATVSERGATLRATIEIYDATTSERVADIDLAGPAGDMIGFARAAGTRIRRRLGRPQLSVEDDSALRVVLPDSADALSAYVAGLAARRHFQWRAAVERFEDTVRRAPRYGPGWAALAHALWLLDQDARAGDAARRAVALAPGLPRDDELAIYALAAEISTDWTAAIDQYRTLMRFYPDRTEYALALGRSLVRSGKPREAVAMLEQTMARPLSDWERLRVSLMRFFAYDIAADDGNALSAARLSAELAERVGARGALGVALVDEAKLHMRAGRIEVAETLYRRARALLIEVGNDTQVRLCDNGMAGIARQRGDYGAALAIYEALLAKRREIGDAWGTASAIVNIGDVFAAQGRLAEARDKLDEGGAMFVRIGNKGAGADRLLGITEIDLDRGQLAGASERIAEARAIYAELGQGFGIASADAQLARLARLEGRMADAEAKAEAAYTEAVAAGHVDVVAEVARVRAVIALERGAPSEAARFDDARRAAERAGAQPRLLFTAFAAHRAMATGDRAAARRYALTAEAASRPHGLSRVVALTSVIDAFAASPGGSPPDAPDLDPATLDALRAELAALVPKLEATEPRRAALAALNRRMARRPEGRADRP